MVLGVNAVMMCFSSRETGPNTTAHKCVQCSPSGALAATDTCCSRLGPIQQTTSAAASTDGLQADFVSPDMQDKYNSDMQEKYKYKYKVQIQDKNTKTAFCSFKTPFKRNMDKQTLK